jgi:hypothetical protein
MYNNCKLQNGDFMRKTTLNITLLCLFSSISLASYTYEVYTYGENKSLYNETILVDFLGGMDNLSLFNNSSATILGTSALNEGFGGIWQIDVANNSSLYMSGGQVKKISINHDATATLKGGYITQILSYQYVTPSSGPHITIVYSGDLPTLNTTTNVLSGTWGNGTGFSIYLPNISDYSPAIDNIRFELIPEPATLAMLVIGGIFLRRRK